MRLDGLLAQLNALENQLSKSGTKTG